MFFLLQHAAPVAARATRRQACCFHPKHEAVEGLISASPIATIMANLMASTSATASLQRGQRCRLRQLATLTSKILKPTRLFRLSQSFRQQLCPRPQTEVRTKSSAKVMSDCRFKQLGDLSSWDYGGIQIMQLSIKCSRDMVRCLWLSHAGRCQLPFCESAAKPRLAAWLHSCCFILSGRSRPCIA